MEKVKLCKDCKHFRNAQISGYQYVSNSCGRAEIMKPDYVYGNLAWLNRKQCEKERDDPAPNACGKEGRYWEPKG